MAAECLHASCIAHCATPALPRQSANMSAQHARRDPGTAQRTLRPPQQLQCRLLASRCRPARRCGCMSTSASSAEQQTLRANSQEEAYDQLADRVLDLANPASRCAADQWPLLRQIDALRKIRLVGTAVCLRMCCMPWYFSDAVQVHGGDRWRARQRQEHSGSRGVAAAERTQGGHRTARRMPVAVRHCRAHGW